MTSLALCSAGVVFANCGFSGGGEDTGAAGTGATGSAGTGNNSTGEAGTTGSAGTGSTGSAGTGIATGSAGTTGTGTGTAGTTGAAGVTGAAGTGTTGAAGTGTAPGTFKNYELSGSFPTATIAIPTKAGGKLTYSKFLVHNQFLAESCSIADYNDDGKPDVSAGRLWYEGTGNPAAPINPTGHFFRPGHGALPKAGAGPEIDTGVSDDWSDFPWDVNGDGAADIINISNCDVNEVMFTNPKIGIVQPHATAYWYQNPGKAALTATPDQNWPARLIHGDVRLEQHGLVDMNGDGFPEFWGACKSCGTSKGYYQKDPANPTAGWTFKAVSAAVVFPFGGTGWLHGQGAGYVNNDKIADLMSREGIWIQGPNGTWGTEACATPTSTACMIKTPLYDQSGGDQKGASHMYGVDMDIDGCGDVVGADWAHGVGLSWYQQGKTGGNCTGTFTKRQFMADVNDADKTKWGAGFTQPHALQVVDMDGDGRPDVITGKMRFAHPNGYGDPDLNGTPYLYVFQNVATPDSRNGGPITLKPMKVDGDPAQAAGTPAGGMGVGRQLSVGHINTDGIPDICISSKVGLAVFLGQ